MKIGKIAIALILAANSFGMDMEAKLPAIMRGVNRDSMEQWTEAQFNAMTPKERVAQLFMPQITNNATNLKGEIIPFIKNHKVGGIITSHGSIDDFLRTVKSAQATAKVPLLVSIDGEWGVSMRLNDVIDFPRNMALGAIADDRLLYEYGVEVGRQCKLLGINIDFAPVVDVNTNSKNPAIGRRSFGENPETVARKSIAFSKGMEDGKVLSVSKHFPGHGASIEDSHKTLPIIKSPLSVIENVDLLPFRRYIDAGLGGVMVAHLNVPALDKSGTPTTFSRKVVHDLLQKDMKFEGLVFTDALVMKGAASKGSPSVNALKAGNDVLLCPANLGSEINAVMAALKSGELSQKEIDEKVKKVLRFKYALGAADTLTTTPEQAKAELNSPRAIALLHELRKASATVFINNNNLLPLKNLQGVAVFTPAGTMNDFVDECRNYTEVNSYSTIAAIKGAKASTIIVPITNSNEASVSRLASAVATGKNVVAVFFMTPYGISRFANSLKSPNVAAVCMYEDEKITRSYGVQAIFGGIGVSGTLPVTIQNVAKVGTGFKYDPIRLSFTTPQQAGVDNKILSVVDSLVNVGLKNGAFPGCQVLMARKGKVFLNKSYGVTDNVLKELVTNQTLYDLASVSKATGTLSGVMKAYDKGLIDLDEKASKYIPGLIGTDKEDLKVREFLYHETGIEPSLDMFEFLMDTTTFQAPLFRNKKSAQYPELATNGKYINKDARIRTDIISPVKTDKYSLKISEGVYGVPQMLDTILGRIYQLPVRPTKDYTYSCLNFALMMDAVQRTTKMRHDSLVYQQIFRPLGAFRTVYRPLEHYKSKEVAPTEIDKVLRGGKVHGYVHDEMACFSGGLSGNAGLFSTATDIAKYCQMLLNRGEYGGNRILKSSTVDTFVKSKSPTCHRGLGFDKPNKVNESRSSTTSLADASVVGHTGFTGTIFWVDPKNEMIFVFLTNRVNPTRRNVPWNKLGIRSKLFAEFYKALQE